MLWTRFSLKHALLYFFTNGLLQRSPPTVSSKNPLLQICFKKVTDPINKFISNMLYDKDFSKYFLKFKKKGISRTYKSGCCIVFLRYNQFILTISSRRVLKEGKILTHYFDSKRYFNLNWIWSKPVFARGPCKSLASRQKLCYYYFVRQRKWHLYVGTLWYWMMQS